MRIPTGCQPTRNSSEHSSISRPRDLAPSGRERASGISDRVGDGLWEYLRPCGADRSAGRRHGLGGDETEGSETNAGGLADRDFVVSYEQPSAADLDGASFLRSWMLTEGASEALNAFAAGRLYVVDVIWLG